MKTLKISLLIVAGLLLTTILKAADSGSSEYAKFNLKFKENISKQVKYPSEAMIHLSEGRVSVMFIVDDFGKIKVTDINGHPEFVGSVKEQLESIPTKPYEYTVGEEMLLKFRFDIVE